MNTLKHTINQVTALSKAFGTTKTNFIKIHNKINIDDVKIILKSIDKALVHIENIAKLAEQ